MDTEKAIKLIRSAGGLPILAHPGLLEVLDLFFRNRRCHLIAAVTVNQVVAILLRIILLTRFGSFDDIVRFPHGAVMKTEVGTAVVVFFQISESRIK